MLAETVSLDGDVIALFLAVVIAAGVAWMALGYLGYRLIRRGQSMPAFVGIGAVAATDAWLVWFAIDNGAVLVTLPAVVHLIGAVQRLSESRRD